jgi:hypothetical protein
MSVKPLRLHILPPFLLGPGRPETIRIRQIKMAFSSAKEGSDERNSYFIVGEQKTL